MQRTLESLRQRLRASERARDDAAEQLCRAIQGADRAGADAQVSPCLSLSLGVVFRPHFYHTYITLA